MRILLTADAELPVPPTNYGGIERIVASLIAAYRALGHTVGLVAQRDSTAQVDAFYPWPGKTSTNKADSLHNALALYQAASNFRPDVLHSFSRLLWLWPLRFLPGHRFPLVMSYQRDPTGPTIQRTRRWLGPRLRYTGCSAHIAQKGRERGGGEWQGIPNFIDPSQLTFVPEVAPDAPLVFLSRIEPIKGCHTAIAIAKASGRRLLIAGNRVETGSAAGYWEREIAPHLGREGIAYIGTVDNTEKNTLLGQAAAMVVPIEWEEPFGIVFAESLACGTPVIACPRGAVPEIVQHGVHGFHINSVEEGTRAVEQLEQISRAACRERVNRHFTVEVVARQYLDWYGEGAST